MEPNNQTGAPSHKKIGPIIVVLVVILVLVIVGLYIFASRIDNGTQDAWTSDTAVETPVIPAVTNISDDPQTLSDDLDAALEGIDAQTF